MYELLFRSSRVVCVLFGGEASQSFFKEVDLEGVEGGDKSVDSEIEFESINKQRTTQVL